MPQPKDKSLATAYVLLLTTGWFGGHHFYLKEPLLGWLCVLFFWTGLPLLASLVELVTLPGRVRRVNRRIQGLFWGDLPPEIYPARFCDTCGRHVGLVSALRTGRDVNRNIAFYSAIGLGLENLGRATGAIIPSLLMGSRCIDCFSGREPDQEWPAEGFTPTSSLPAASAPQRLACGLLGLVLLAGAGWLIWHGLGQQLYHAARLNLFWERVPAQVLHVDVAERSWTDRKGRERVKGYVLLPEYRYTMQGRSWLGTALCPEPPLFESRKVARAFMEGKAGGPETTAYVDPAAPDRAYLSAYSGTRLVSRLLPGLLALLPAVFLLRCAFSRSAPAGGSDARK